MVCAQHILHIYIFITNMSMSPETEQLTLRTHQPRRLRSIYNKPLLRQQNKITSDIFSFIPALAGHPKMAPALPTDLTRRVWFHTPASTCRQGGGVCGTPCHLSSFCSETCKHSLALGFIPSSGGSGSLRPHFPVSSKTIFESHTYIETHKHTHNLMWDR